MPELYQTRRDFLAAAGSIGLAALGGPFASAAAAADYARKVLAKKPAAYWRLGEARGPTAHDSSGHGRHGTYHGRPAFHRPGAIRGDKDRAVQLDGKRSYVEVPGAAAFSQPTSGRGLTVEVWFRPDTLRFKGETKGGYIHWLGKGKPGHQEWALRFYSRTAKKRPNRVSAYIFNPDGKLGAGAYFQDRLAAGVWIHVVACFEPGDAGTRGQRGVHIYKDGEHRLGPPSRGTLYNNPPKWRIKPVRGDGPLRLGTYLLKGFLAGALDEVAVYPRVLTAQEVLENYNAARSG
jgi:hypothetical protein